MPISAVPFLDHDDIELKAEQVLDFIDPSLTQSPKKTPLLEIMECFKREFELVYDFDQDLGETSHGTKVLGTFCFKPRGILIDKSLQGQSGFPFTLAHEIGHFVLHRKLKITPEDYAPIIDTQRELVTGRKQVKTTKERIEWQANKFASAFLMPRKTFKDALISVQTRIGIVRNLGMVYLDGSAASQRDFGSLLTCLQEIFDVSRSTLEFRLSDLRLMQDMRYRDTRHISQLLRD